MVTQILLVVKTKYWKSNKILSMSKIFLVLKYLREQKGVYQKKVASDLNIETNTYGSWERGNTEPPIDMLIALAKYYGVSVDYLVGVENEDYTKVQSDRYELSANVNELQLMETFRVLNAKSKEELVNFAQYLKSKEK